MQGRKKTAQEAAGHSDMTACQANLHSLKLSLIARVMRGPKMPVSRLRRLPGRQALAATAAVLLLLVLVLIPSIARSPGLRRFKQRAVQAFKCYAEVSAAAAANAALLLGVLSVFAHPPGQIALLLFDCAGGISVHEPASRD